MGSESVRSLAQRKIDEPVHLPVCGLRRDDHGFGALNVAARDDGLEPDTWMLVLNARLKDGERTFQAIAPAAGHASGVGSGAVVFGGQQLLEERAVDDFVRFEHAQCFEEVMLGL